MSPRTAAVPEIDLCRDVVSAALERFLRYGYNKTTMAEIAEDVGMSAANLYRYFDNKHDIAAACCTRCMNERLDRLQIVASSPGTLRDRLERYTWTMIEHTNEMADPDSKIAELIETVTRERPQLVQEKLEVHYALIAAMLGDAVDDGEIVCSDLTSAAKNIYSALVVFDVPMFVGLYSKGEFRKRATGVVSLLLVGLKGQQ